jgi:transcriptional regulator with XRE-family HTH domain
MLAGMDRKQLADFLRTRRAKVTPQDVGLPNNRRRRLPGLRREEVAQLAGISEDYYARLEQSRSPRPSRQVLSALGRALMLTTEERTHLFHLAGETLDEAMSPRQDVPEGITHLLRGLDSTPAFVLDAKYDLLAWNVRRQFATLRTRIFPAWSPRCWLVAMSSPGCGRDMRWRSSAIRSSTSSILRWGRST